MVSVCYVATWFSVHFQRPIEHDFGDRASHVGKVFSEHLYSPLIKHSSEWKKRIPDSMHSKFARITSKTDAFCQRYLNDEYRQLVRTAVAALCRKRPSPLLRGSEDFWAAGFIHAIGNFVFDKSQTPHCTAPDIYSFFGVASSTGQGKSKQIRQWLKIHPFSFQWGLPSKFDSNPLIWMLTVNGMMVDIRHLPIEVQEVAYQKGLIPYVPGAKHS